jgi:hypothetical protein
MHALSARVCGKSRARDARRAIFGAGSQQRWGEFLPQKGWFWTLMGFSKVGVKSSREGQKAENPPDLRW